MPADPARLREAARAALAAGDGAAAFGHLRQALAAAPQDGGNWRALAELYLALKQPAEAIEAARRALSLAGDDGEALELSGLAQGALGDAKAAEASYRSVLALEPGRVRARLAFAALLLERGAMDEAAAEARTVTANPAAPAHGWRVLGEAELAQEQGEAAASALQRFLALVPDDAEAWHNLGLALDLAQRPDEAGTAFERALSLQPTLWAALSQLCHLKRRLCDWRGLDALSLQLRQAVASGGAGIEPFAFLAEPSTPAEQLRCARGYADAIVAAVQPLAREFPPAQASGAAGERVRVGFVSSGFHNHPTGLLIVDLIERLRGSALETVAFATARDDGGAIRARLQRAFAEFHSCHALDRLALARLIRSRSIEVLIDLRGYGGGHVAEIFALRPAPVQVNWLAYPGTSGASYIDYLLADRYVVPPAQRGHYSEALAWLPHCFQPSDASRQIAASPSRSECALPLSGPVLASFNNSYKISPECFDCWMQILEAVPAAVLWLLDPGDVGDAAASLRREAAQRGVGPERLHFMRKLPHDEYLARYAQVDLFLDTWPYGAHTTASDALFAGCPLLTLAGETFAARVAGSLLTTLGLEQLIAPDRTEYVARAIAIAAAPERLAAIRQRLSQQRLEAPLFDLARFARDFATTIASMAIRARAGLGPQDFPVGG
jgi:predicted O-linked N-acetylglucosamine transferase (SPINDLY family)